MLKVETPLPTSGTGIYSYSQQKDQFGVAETIEALLAIGAAWQQAHPNGPAIGIGHISRKGGGKMPPHQTHRIGLDVDIRPMRKDGKRLPVTFQSAAYSRPLTRELVTRIRGNGVLLVRSILFNDPLVQGVKPFSGHDNHLHVTFDAPGSGPPVLRRGATGPAVRELQTRLNLWLAAVGKPPITVDGDFGPRTEAVVKAFQGGMGLVVDGIVGPVTWERLP
jgi:murein endopeptidase